MIREIKIISSTRQGVKTLNSEVETWGQLKDSLHDYGNLSSMTAVVKETRNSLQVDEARLPEGDFTLYLSPKQIKAGTNDRSVAILESLKDKLSEAIDEIILEIEDGDYDHLSAGKSSKSSSSEVSAEDRAMLESLKGI